MENKDTNKEDIADAVKILTVTFIIYGLVTNLLPYLISEGVIKPSPSLPMIFLLVNTGIILIGGWLAYSALKRK